MRAGTRHSEEWGFLMPKLADLLEQRAQAVQSLRTLSDTAEQAGRDLNEAEQRSFKETKDRITELDARIERQKQLDAMERAAPAIVSPGNLGDGSFEQRCRTDYSICRAILGAVPSELRANVPANDGFEREASQELARIRGRQPTGILVPDVALEPRTEQRTLLTSGDAAGLIGAPHLSGQFIERFRPATIVERLGATMLNDLVGAPVELPKQVASGTTAWLTESQALDFSDAEFDGVTLNPHTVGSLTSVSRRTLINSTPSVEAVLKRDLQAIVANELDRVALWGNGSNNEPVGIRFTPGIQEYETEQPSSGQLSWRDVNNIPAMVEGADVPGDGLAWAMSAFTKAKLRSTPRERKRATDTSGSRTATSFLVTLLALALPSPALRVLKRRSSSAASRI